jgi:hypothetical protein
MSEQYHRDDDQMADVLGTLRYFGEDTPAPVREAVTRLLMMIESQTTTLKLLIDSTWAAASKHSTDRISELERGINEAIAALGSGHCKIQQCEGCEVDKSEARASLVRALGFDDYAVPPETDSRIEENPSSQAIREGLA